VAVLAAERFDLRNIQMLTSALQREIERRIPTGEIEAGGLLAARRAAGRRPRPPDTAERRR
jgi:hypothetical protein